MISISVKDKTFSSSFNFKVCLFSALLGQLHPFPEIPKDNPVIVDLTHELLPGSPRSPIIKELTKKNLIYQLQGRGNLLKFEDLELATHYGTHLDAPSHVRGSWSLEDIPLERLVLVPAAVINVTNKVFPENCTVKPDYLITVEDIEEWEEKHYRMLPKNGVVLFYTDFSRYWNDVHLYQGGTTLNTLSFPGLAPETARWLVNNRPNLYGVGIDTLSIDGGISVDLLSHNYLTTANWFILENLTNLDKLPPYGAKINIGVLKLGNRASGAQARVVAIFSKSN